MKYLIAWFGFLFVIHSSFLCGGTQSVDKVDAIKAYEAYFDACKVYAEASQRVIDYFEYEDLSKETLDLYESSERLFEGIF